MKSGACVCGVPVDFTEMSQNYVSGLCKCGRALVKRRTSKVVYACDFNSHKWTCLNCGEQGLFEGHPCETDEMETTMAVIPVCKKCEL